MLAQQLQHRRSAVEVTNKKAPSVSQEGLLFDLLEQINYHQPRLILISLPES